MQSKLVPSGVSPWTWHRRANEKSLPGDSEKSLGQFNRKLSGPCLQRIATRRYPPLPQTWGHINSMLETNKTALGVLCTLFIILSISHQETNKRIKQCESVAQRKWIGKVCVTCNEIKLYWCKTETLAVALTNGSRLSQRLLRIQKKQLQFKYIQSNVKHLTLVIFLDCRYFTCTPLKCLVVT